MKIILSRKGFDASHGGVASPILHDGTVVSVLIPARDSAIVYDQLVVGSRSLASIVEHLTNRRIRGGARHPPGPRPAGVYVRSARGMAVLVRSGGRCTGTLASPSL